MDLNDGVFVEHSAAALFEHEIASCLLIGWEGPHTHIHHSHCQAFISFKYFLQAITDLKG